MNEKRGAMTTAALLESLTQHNAGNWATVASVLIALEAVSSVSPEGRSWHDVVAARLTELGHPVSIGHLRKIKRVWRFILSQGCKITTDGCPLGPADMEKASLLAIETTVRLHDLDPQAGLEALKDCLSGVPNSEIQSRLQSAQASYPERLSPRQIGWGTRRKASATPNPAREAAKVMSLEPMRWWGEMHADPREIEPGTIVPLLVRTPVGVIYVNDAGICTGGVRSLDNLGKNFDLIESVLAQSSFFDRYWLVVTDETSALLSIFEDVLDYGAVNVGLLLFKEGDLSIKVDIDAPPSFRPRQYLKDAVAGSRWGMGP